MTMMIIMIMILIIIRMVTTTFIATVLVEVLVFCAWSLETVCCSHKVSVFDCEEVSETTGSINPL